MVWTLSGADVYQHQTGTSMKTLTCATRQPVTTCVNSENIDIDTSNKCPQGQWPCTVKLKANKTLMLGCPLNLSFKWK